MAKYKAGDRLERIPDEAQKKYVITSDRFDNVAISIDELREERKNAYVKAESPVRILYVLDETPKTYLVVSEGWIMHNENRPYRVKRVNKDRYAYGGVHETIEDARNKYVAIMRGNIDKRNEETARMEANLADFERKYKEYAR